METSNNIMIFMLAIIIGFTLVGPIIIDVIKLLCMYMRDKMQDKPND